MNQPNVIAHITHDQCHMSLHAYSFNRGTEIFVKEIKESFQIVRTIVFWTYNFHILIKYF
jgi:hypothetical protein